MRSCNDVFSKFIEEMDIENISTSDGLNHPVLFLLQENGMDCVSRFQASVQFNTKEAIRNIKNSGKFDCWLRKRKKIVLGKNRVNASSSFGEIRCLGNIISAFPHFDICTEKPIKNGCKPDFIVSCKNKSVYIETYTLQMNGEEADKLSKIHNENRNSSDGIVISECSYYPYGVRSKYSLIESAMAKINSIKEESFQFSNDNVNILWIDLQDEYMDSASMMLDIFNPINSSLTASSVEGFYSNILWYSLYAPKGTPIFDAVHLIYGEGNRVKLQKTSLDGKFVVNNSNISAIVFSGSDSVVVCENANAKNKIPKFFVKNITSLSKFKFELSRMNFPANNLKSSIGKEINMINKLANNIFYSW